MPSLRDRLKSKKKAQSSLKIKTSKKSGGPVMYKGYNIKWLKGLGEEHPASKKLVGKYEKKYGEIK